VPWIWKLAATLLPLPLGAALITAAVLGARSVHGIPRSGGWGSQMNGFRRVGRLAELAWLAIGASAPLLAAGMVALRRWP
jgi:hypothetical protein